MFRVPRRKRGGGSSSDGTYDANVDPTTQIVRKLPTSANIAQLQVQCLVSTVADGNPLFCGCIVGSLGRQSQSV